MQKIIGLYVWVFLLQGSLVLAQEQPISGSKPVSEELARHYLRMARELGSREVPKTLAYADSLEEAGKLLKNRKWLYYAYKTKGDLYSRIGDYNEAFYWFQHAFSNARVAADTLGMVRISNNLGTLYQKSGALDKALENYLQTLHFGKSYLNPGQKATVLLNVGMVHEELAQLQEALSFYLQALELIEGEEPSASLAFVHANLGALYTKQNNKEKAIAHLKIARKIFEGQGDENNLAEVLNAFSLVHLENNPEISVEYLTLAKKLYKKNHHIAGLFEVYKNLGDAFGRMGKYDLALQYLNEARQYADTLNNTFYKGKVLLQLAYLSELQHHYKKSTDYYSEYVALSQSNHRNELLRNVATTQSNFELALKNDQIDVLEKEAKQASAELQQLYIIVFFLAAILLFGTGLILFYKFRLKKAGRLNLLLKSRNQMIQSQKEEIKEQHTLIATKRTELEQANKVNKEYFNELFQVKNQLEDKINERTKALEDTNRKLSFHINSTPLAVLEWNHLHELVHWPKQAEVIFGYSAREVLGLKMEEVPFLLAEDKKEVLEVVEQLCRGELSRQYFTRKSMDRYGHPLFIEWSYSVLLNSEGEMESVLSMANDVTLRELTYRQLKDANQELDTFLYKSSHDLRGPIARMQGIINLGILESEDPAAHLYFKMLNKVTDELNNLLLRLLMVHNINQHEYKEERLLFAAFVDKLVASHTRNSISFREMEVRNKISGDLVLLSDGTLLEIIIVNLLQNAMVFADNFSPVVEIDAVHLPSGKYIISVADNGVGIPAEFQEKIFDMFFQGSTRSTGTGLGLYMVRKAVKKLGGEIKLRSGSGQTEFEITLPALKTLQVSGVEV